MSNNGILDLASVREEVTEHFVKEMLHSSPQKQEKFIRLLLNRMPRSMIDPCILHRLRMMVNPRTV